LDVSGKRKEKMEKRENDRENSKKNKKINGRLIVSSTRFSTTRGYG
jgi:hypothetical protein